MALDQVLADLVVTAVGSLIAILGALWISDRTFKKDTERERHLQVEEWHQRDAERARAESDERRRLLYAFVTECFVNLEAIQHMRLNRPGAVPLRRDYLDKIMPYMSTSHPDVAGAVQRLSVRIDRVNGTPIASPMHPDLTGEAMTFILEAAKTVTHHLKEAQEGPEA